jgi:hydroxylamine oxidation protein HaoB
MQPARLAAAIFFVLGLALIGAAGIATLRSPPEPFEVSRTRAEASAIKDLSAFEAKLSDFEAIEIRASESEKPLASGLVAKGADGRLAPLAWRSLVTEPILLPQINLADEAKALLALKEQAPKGAIVLAWWDLSRRIRALAERAAPLDDPHASGALIPDAWSAARAEIEARQRAFWGAGVAFAEGDRFQKFIDALLAEEEETGARLLAEIAAGKPIFLALRLADVWRAAAARPEAISVAYRDFAGAGDLHAAMKAVRDWFAERRIEGGYAVEPFGGAYRIHYFPDRKGSRTLLARLLPFSTSNPMAMTRFRLVYQYRDYWLYELVAPSAPFP